jgi:hypothetical protein
LIGITDGIPDADVSNLSFGQFGPRTLAASETGRPYGLESPLCDHVGVVVEPSAFEEMPSPGQGVAVHFVYANVIVADAILDIASVANSVFVGEHFIRRLLPGDAMGVKRDPVRSAGADCPVPANQPARPQPA